jgi:hypothetical protein
MKEMSATNKPVTHGTHSINEGILCSGNNVYHIIEEVL